MIHYHGTPITPDTAAVRAIGGGHAFVSFAAPRQLELVVEVASTFVVDNGAFSRWKSGERTPSWEPYYAWVNDLRRIPNFDWSVIPDVIDGGEEENDALLEEWPHERHEGAPVWHLHEPIERLERLAAGWPRVCLGSSGPYATIGTRQWWARMHEAIGRIVDDRGRPRCKLHGLRMLDPNVFRHLPFASADSTNIARNIGIDKKWGGPYAPAFTEARAAVMRERIEGHQSTSRLDIHAGAQEEFTLVPFELCRGAQAQDDPRPGGAA